MLKCREAVERLLREYRAGGIGGRAKEDGACPGRDGIPHGVEIEVEILLFQRGHEDGDAGGQQHVPDVGGIGGRGQDHLVAGVDARHDGGRETLDGAHGDHDLRGIGVDLVVALQFRCDGLPQGGQAGGGGVAAHETVANGGHGALLDVFGRVRGRLGPGEEGHVFVLHGEPRHLVNGGRGDVEDPLGGGRGSLLHGRFPFLPA